MEVSSYKMSNLDIPLVLPELKFELIVWYFQHNSETNVENFTQT